MKIAQVNSYFHPFMIGGAEWYVYNISKELVKAGHEVTVFTSDAYNGQRVASEDTIDGVRVKRLPLRVDWTYRVKLWKGLRDALRKGGFDLIHTYDYAQRHSIDALEAARSADVKSALTVFDVHGSIPRAWYKQFPMKFMDRYCAGRTFPLATRILVRAPDLIGGLPGAEKYTDKIRVSPSGVRPESLAPFDGSKFREKHSIKGSPVVLFLGRLNPLKGPQFLIEAAPQLAGQFPGIEFVFVGPDQNGYLSHLMERARKLGVSDRVHFTGMISDFEEKMQAYSSCDVFALPTSYEGTSQAIFEAMAQGKPVVATRTGGIPFQVRDGTEGYLVDYGDFRALGEKLALLLGSESARSEAGRNAKEKASRFQYPALASRLLTEYEEVLGTRGS